MDLTSSPSPPPLSAPDQHHHPSNYADYPPPGVHPSNYPGYPPCGVHPSNCSSYPPPGVHPSNCPGYPHYAQSARTVTGAPEEVAPRTPVCIGQLIVTALILYPMPYLNFHVPGTPTTHEHPDNNEFASVRLVYDIEGKQRSPTAEDTVNIIIPKFKTGDGPNDPVYGGNALGIVEQKVATILGPMLGKGLIRIDARIRRGAPNLPNLPLHLLLFTPKGNIHIVSQYLQSSRLMLDHPAQPFDLNVPPFTGVLYSNPHMPPPGGFGQKRCIC